ncbi:uncharacterized protein YlxW (UPF0749 family) [Micromonospora pisi]|uniref:Uncharacterized protein YlxW (UPF0749 family) n=1 Tax=Micromonospora pisi TaxID=589240 RepID=A0A495JY44_9ACTN|nr:DUF881 domain-containing protein [Micromonospora pisi]RKR93184.1 uncharacterized protein YlxW (UPF0749 family) [Micromonospora pisi]
MSDEQRQSGSDAEATVPVGGALPVDAVPEGSGAESAGSEGVGLADGPTVDLAGLRRSVVAEGGSGGGSAGVRPGVGDPVADDPDGVDDPSASRLDSDVDQVGEPAGPAREPVAGRSRWSGASVIIAVLLALLGFTLVVQLKSNSADPELAATRQEDLVRILSDLESQEERLRQDIAGLEESQRQLASGAQGRQAALDEATRRADELGILAGRLPARGPGLTVTFSAGAKPVEAATLLDAVQELRGAGAEAMQISGGGGAVRIVASTFFLDDGAGVAVSGKRLTGPYTITVIGDPSTMRTALNIPGGVVASVTGDGGNVTVQEREVVDVSTLSAPLDLKHARPVS